MSAKKRRHTGRLSAKTLYEIIAYCDKFTNAGPYNGPGELVFTAPLTQEELKHIARVSRLSDKAGIIDF